MSDQATNADGDHYEIRVKGHLDRRWSRRFGGMSITLLPEGETLLRGQVVDQSALHGMLNQMGDLGLKILLVREIGLQADAPSGSGDKTPASSSES